MRGDKKTRLLARQLFRLSLVDGQVSPERVAGVLGYVEKTAPRHAVGLLKLYHRAIQTELAKSRAVVEHAGPLPADALASIERALSRRYGRAIAATGNPAPALLAGLRVRVGSDLYESTVAGQLGTLSNSG